MNNISLICGILYIGILAADITPVHSTENAQDSQTTAPSQPSIYTPSLSCIVLGNLGCGVQCSYIGKLQNAHLTLGQCDKNQACICNIQSGTLRELWNAKFNSDDILKQIKKDKTLIRKVGEALRNPYKTGEQSKQDLEEILPKEMFEKLRLRYDTNKLNQRNPDLADLKKFVEKKMLSEVLGSPYYNHKHPERHNWLLSLFNFLRETKDEASIQSIYHQIALTNNDTLKGKLENYLKRYPESPRVDTTVQYEQDSGLPQVVTNMALDGMINHVKIPEDFRNFP
ncbi:uncharacterized protein LOC135844892 [Planococcus citri]|uniref:uncharacterized protein LOC135844892 n=1 Tax=Planococcus citri TaxID=170843 RepID=UPI0031F995C5